MREYTKQRARKHQAMWENIDQQVRKQNKQKHSALTKWIFLRKTMWSSSMSFLPFIQARH
jgi:hypothetical protein